MGISAPGLLQSWDFHRRREEGHKPSWVVAEDGSRWAWQLPGTVGINTLAPAEFPLFSLTRVSGFVPGSLVSFTPPQPGGRTWRGRCWAHLLLSAPSASRAVRDRVQDRWQPDSGPL